MMKLQDTIELMVSTDYKERFTAEFVQLEIRIKGLANMLDKYKEGTLPFTTTCDYDTLNSQLEYMRKYSDVLQHRAVLESIELPNV